MQAEIQRVNKIHRRADEAVKQRLDGHIIASLVVLHHDESEDGQEVKWSDEDLEVWPRRKEALVAQLRRDGARFKDRDCSVVGPLDRIDDALATGILSNSHNWAAAYKIGRARGLIMFKQSEAYLAANPPPDPYTNGDRKGTEERG